MGKKKSNKLVVNLSDDEDDKETTTTTTTTTNTDDYEDKIEEKEEQDESEESDQEKGESKGKMIQRHKMEIKKLQQTIDKMNHAIPKKDKKAKTDLAVKTKKMEDELKKKHQLELDEYEKVNATNNVPSLDQLLINNENIEQKAPSKAYLKKAQKLKQEEDRMKQLEQDKKNHVSKGTIEHNELLLKLKPLNKTIKFITPDGDCLYQAITNQLLINNEISQVESNGHAKKLRSVASNYILGNQDEFLPFIISEEEYADSEDPIADYCQEQVLTIGKWGGHIELKALSQSLKKSITIFNSNSKDIVIGEDFNSSPQIYLSYHRHAFTLGEHYNSVVPIIESKNKDDDQDE